MSTEYEIAETLDTKGENCPMPVIKTKRAIDGLGVGDVLEVIATDPGSLPDIDGWASSVDTAELVEQIETEEGGRTVYKHYVRRIE